MKKITHIPNLCDYWAGENGKIYRLSRSANDLRGIMKEVRPVRTNVRDKCKGVYLFGKDKNKRFYYVHKLMLEVYKGVRGPEWKPGFMSRNTLNCRLSNLRWELKEGACLYMVLNDEEYARWVRKLDSIPKKRQAEFNDRTWNKYREVSNELAADPAKRREFWREEFKVKRREVFETTN